MLIFSWDKPGGFTLIELLIVIAILGVLAAGVVVAINPSKRISDAQQAVIKMDFASMDSTIKGERIIRGIVLGNITGSFCSICGECRGVDVRNTNCVNTMNQSWQNVTGKNIPKDPFGNPYTIDENEGEGGMPNCTNDYIYSAGPDHGYGTADDIRHAVPTFRCTN